MQPTQNKFKGLFTSLSPHYATPAWLKADLDKEFHFNDDPCPLNGEKIFPNGLSREWGTHTYVNPPYGREIGAWIKKAYKESYTKTGKLVVMLLPSRTDTAWWHDWVMQAEEIRFIRGRLKFNDGKGSAPFPSCIVIFNGLSPGRPKLD